MSQENGKLWDELAACIKWARRNEDVLADIHWVGGTTRCRFLQFAPPPALL